MDSESQLAHGPGPVLIDYATLRLHYNAAGVGYHQWGTCVMLIRVYQN